MDVIVTHVYADFDALGGLAGASLLYPDSVMVLPGGQSAAVGDFLSLHKDVLPVRTPAEVDPEAITRVVVVDANMRSRLGAAGEWLDLPDVEVHLFDHHPGEGDIPAGEVDVREWGAVSTILARRLRERGVEPEPVRATALLLGVYEDTGSLTFAGTAPEDLEAAAWLLRCGASLDVVAEFARHLLAPPQRQLLGKVLEALETVPIGNVPVAISAASSEEYVEDAAVIVHRVLDLEDVAAAVALLEMGDALHVIARSRSDLVDVRAVLEPIGGGGHARAAAATLREADPARVKEQVLAGLRKQVRPAPTAAEIMSYPVRTLSPDSTIAEARRRMVRYGHSGLVVMDDGKMVGIVSRRDVDKARHHHLEHAPVRGFMSRDPVTVAPGTPLPEIQRMLIDGDVGRLPVVRGDEVIGIVTRRDVLRALHGEKYLAGTPRMAEEEATRLVRERLPAAVQRVIERVGEIAAREGAQAYLVGGIVRDLLQDVPNLDVDILVEPDGMALARAVAAELGGEVKEHDRFGTAPVELPDGLKLDFTTARTEAYERPGALPVVELSSVVDDLRRRDFTVNAMALHLRPERFGELLDPFGGRCDLDRRRLRVLHNLSFIEDPTRIFRGVRFEERFRFRMDAQAEHLAHDAVEADALGTISADRLRREFRLVVEEPRPVGGLLRLDAFGVLEWLHPELSPDRELLGAIPGALQWWKEHAEEPVDPAQVYFGALLAPLGPEAADEVSERRLNLPAPDRAALRQGLHALRDPDSVLPADDDPANITRRLRPLPDSALVLLRAALRNSERRSADALERYVTEWRHVRLEITGHDLKATGHPAGPALGRALEATLAARLNGEIAGRDAELRYATELLAGGERGDARG